MPARLHTEIGQSPDEHEVRFWPPDLPVCRFCDTELLWEEIDNHWSISTNEIAEYHRDTIEWMTEFHGEVMYNDLEFVEEPSAPETSCGFCPACGWWVVDQEIEFRTRHNLWRMHFGGAGALKNLDLSDVSLPLEEIRTYLTARYETRFDVHPRRFEEVVASVFGSLGYDSCVTAYTNDGGIDAVLTKGSRPPIGVQVKRFRNRIKVEQIRAFLGALTLAGYTKGLFVTTTSFQRGAKTCANAAAKNGTAIRLIDTNKFFDLLKIAEVQESDGKSNLLSWLNPKDLQLQRVHEHPLGSV